MRPVYQTRTGEIGNCFAACLASILEEPLPELGLTSDHDYDENVNKWLAARGLRYTQVPSDVKPMGWTTIEGISPRGGMHATVGLDGKIVWDPHPNDGTGHGLVSVERYGLLVPMAKDEEQATARCKKCGERVPVVSDGQVMRYVKHKGAQADKTYGEGICPGSDKWASQYTAAKDIHGINKIGSKKSNQFFARPDTTWRCPDCGAKQSTDIVKCYKCGRRMPTKDARGYWAECPHCSGKAWVDEEGRATSHHDERKQNPTWCAGIGKKAAAKDELHITVSKDDGSVHPNPKFKGQYKKWAKGKDARYLNAGGRPCTKEERDKGRKAHTFEPGRYNPNLCQLCGEGSSAKLHGKVKASDRDRLHRALDAVMDGMLPLPPTEEGRAAYKVGLKARIEELKRGQARGQQPHDLDQAIEQLRRLEAAEG